MNLHEECLLKYLLNPLDLVDSTEMLKLQNILIEKSISGKDVPIKRINIRYRTTRI